MKDNFLYIELSKDGKISSKLAVIIQDLYASYKKAAGEAGLEPKKGEELINQLIRLVNQSIQNPVKFGIFHHCVRKPFDYYQFGLDFIRPLINFEQSKILGREYLKTINDQISKGENVILLANHQTEPDAQIISLLLQDYPDLAEKMIFIAGHRVIEDPMAIPLSMGCNLLCIYSKKHIDNPPEEKQKKVSHNQRTMKKMGELLKEGGKCIYIAPSGGRDRPDSQGHFQVAPFDPQSIEMLWLIAQRAATPTHFYPLTLLTHSLMPPPNDIESEIGEKRLPCRTPVFLGFGQEIDMEAIQEQETDKMEKRNKRAQAIWQMVDDNYTLLKKLKNLISQG